MPLNDYNLEIKRVFLSFAQQLFEQDPKYTWNVDPSQTKINIFDKYAVDLKIIESKRSIVLSRGVYGWQYTSIGQLKEAPPMTPDRKVYSDLISGSITFNCIARQGIVAEHLAHKLFVALTAYKDQFRKNGIHRISNVTLGEENILKSDSNIEVTAIPVYVQFQTQKDVRTGTSFYTIYLEDFDGHRYFQGSDFIIKSINSIEFTENVPKDLTFTAYYAHAVTLAEHEETFTTVEGQREYSLSYPIYGDYPFLGAYEFTVSGISW